MNSIRLNLLRWLSMPLLALNAIGAILIYFLAWIPTETAFDQSLADAAWALIPRVSNEKNTITTDLSSQAEQVLRVDHFDAIFFVIRDSRGTFVGGDVDFPHLHAPDALGAPRFYDDRMRGEDVRVAALKTLVHNTPVVIGVAETGRKRTHIRLRIVITLLMLELVLTLFSAAMVWWGVGRGMLPLGRLQRNMDTRRADDLSPIDEENVAQELLPLVHALNNLLEKLRSNTAARQDFLANVAHQLRTPLAGLRVQLDRLDLHHALDIDATASTSLMKSSVERMIRQTNQLLALARAEPSAFEKARLTSVRLNLLVEESVQHFVDEAYKKRIDLGYDLHPTVIKGDRYLLRDLIDNLVDNAIRYCTPNGTVTVSCKNAGGEVALSVEDSGPGIPAAERERIFDRFYRASDLQGGSGLGLAIVRDIVQDHGAHVTVRNGVRGKGTIFLVRFPSDDEARSLQCRDNNASHLST